MVYEVTTDRRVLQLAPEAVRLQWVSRMRCAPV